MNGQIASNTFIPCAESAHVLGKVVLWMLSSTEFYSMGTFRYNSMSATTGEETEGVFQICFVLLGSISEAISKRCIEVDRKGKSSAALKYYQQVLYR